MDSLTLTPLAKDALMEVMNIGAGNAATALNQMTNMPVTITSPRLELLNVEDVPVFTGKPETVMSVVLMKVLGDAPGVMMLMFPRESALKIAHLLLHQAHTMLDEIDRTALREVGNVLAGSCLSALSQFLHMSFIQSVPNAATDMVGALMSTVLADIGQTHEKVLASEVRFMIPSKNIDGSIFFLFDPASTAKIVTATRKYLPQS